MLMLGMRRTTLMAATAWIAVAAVAVLGSRPLAAQGTRATVRGTVKTAAGAARPSVTVNVVNLDNQNERQAITEADGTWSIAGLLPGRYEIRVDESGFQPYRSAAITLTAGQQRTENISLRPAPPTRTPAQPPPPPPAPPGPPPPPAVVVPDYIPSPDRWHLEFPVWQRYPPELKGAYP